MACTAVVFSKFMDFALRYGADEGMLPRIKLSENHAPSEGVRNVYRGCTGCIISRAKGEEVCGKIIDRGEQGCVLTDDEGWVCA